MAIESPYYPIVYVRGYAATMGEIEETVATPYMGFNLGSTKIRQDYENNIVRFIFESPLVRLMKDEGYVDTYGGGDLIGPGKKVSPRSIWIFRYYENVSKDLGSGKREEIPEFATRLRRFILRIRENVCRGAADRAKFKVYLVAHSMGGLICRCYLQNTCVEGPSPKVELGPGEDLELPGDPLVDKVFTYATPHDGIDLLGMNVPNLGPLDVFDVSNFDRDRIRKYLKLPSRRGSVATLDGKFDPRRFFCFVGTNYRDYQAFFKLSKRATGPMSDGLVMMTNAALADAGSPRAYAHRSHSGHYGIVNSEEGYQNLTRFLFGDVRVDAKLHADEITLPEKVQRAKDRGKDVKAQYNIDVTAKVRQAGYFLSERRVAQASAIRKKYEDLVEAGKPAYLFSGFLRMSERPNRRKSTPMAFAIRIGIEVPLFEVDNRFWFDSHFEGETLLQETVTIHLSWEGERPKVKFGYASERGVGEANHPAEIDMDDKSRVSTVEIPLGFAEGAATKPQPGFRGRLVLTASPWNRG
jgi:hypothetical protein